MFLKNMNPLINGCVDGPNTHIDIYTQEDAKHEN
jgi:hypothetical protein